MTVPLRVRWLGRVPYPDALALQRALFAGTDDHLLLLEHPHVFTLGVRADPTNVLVDPASVGAELVVADRGGDVTYHGPGQLVGYPILGVPGKRGGGMADTAAYVRGVEQVVIDTLLRLGLDDIGRLPGLPGVWVDPGGTPRKIAAVGVRLSRGRSMHGFALNVAPDLTWFDRIVPCGIRDRGVTSLEAEGVRTTMRQVVETIVEVAALHWAGHRTVDLARTPWRERPTDLSPFSRGAGSGTRPGQPVRLLGRLAEAGVNGGMAVATRKPEWLRAPMRHDAAVGRTRRIVAGNGLATVCEEAGCPNLSECWSDGTATFMINGDRCTRSCGFCLVDTRHPRPVDPSEASRVADAAVAMALRHVVITAVARDDLPDGGAAGFAACVRAVRDRCPSAAVELLVPDCGGDPESLEVIFDSRPDVLNHNLETVLRLQRAVRPSASYARSLGVLGRARAAGLVTKSGLMVGLGESYDEVCAALADLAAVGVDIVTIGQYLRPTAQHLPVARWWHPDEFSALADDGRALGLSHVEAGPLTRSSYHASEAAGALLRS